MIRAALVALGLLTAPPASAAECQGILFDGARFTACTVDMQRDDVRLFLRDPKGEVYGTFSRLQSGLADGERLVLAMNAGMFHEDLRPVGLYIEDGIEEMWLVTSDGPGNFGLLPNGVLCISEAGADVIESRRFAEAGPSCRFATQSGPMLVIDGELHPRFRPNSSSLNIRNGVGVSDDGRRMVLAIADEPVNFHHFARLFRDAFDTPNALYLDGRVSRLHAPGIDRSDFGFPVGPIIGIVRTEPSVDGGEG
ncbi:MAG: putative periplasmic protein [Rhodobacteraceae bacterium HLUCCO18]|nr:MAG: putative periplasmic protein [Rhodobacteraceae bacterium HLUCCO18]